MATGYLDAHRDDAQVEAHHHPGPKEYVRIAIILTIITLVEVVIYYIPALRGVLAPVLLALSFAKFSAVVGYFMHLRFDDKRFAMLFGAGLGLSVAVMLACFVLVVTHLYFAPVILPPAS